MGIEITELAEKKFTRGIHTLEFDVNDLSKGIYIYSLKTNQFTATKRMILQD